MQPRVPPHTGLSVVHDPTRPFHTDPPGPMSTRRRTIPARAALRLRCTERHLRDPLRLARGYPWCGPTPQADRRAFADRRLRKGAYKTTVPRPVFHPESRTGPDQ